MRALLLSPLFILAAACAGPKDLEKMSTLDVCYEGMMDADKRQAVEAELNRRKETCDKYDAQLKKMADEEMRAGAAPQGTDSGSTGNASRIGGTGTGSGGGMGRY
jgi:hypothetical protein